MSKIGGRKVVKRQSPRVKKDSVVVTRVTTGKDLKLSKNKEQLSWTCDHRFRLSEMRCASCGELVETPKARITTRKSL